MKCSNKFAEKKQQHGIYTGWGRRSYRKSYQPKNYRRIVKEVLKKLKNDEDFTSVI